MLSGSMSPAVSLFSLSCAGPLGVPTLPSLWLRWLVGSFLRSDRATPRDASLSRLDEIVMAQDTL